MLKKSTVDKQKIVQLHELVSQPQCLKLLILHTPFTLNLHSLNQCINLVKLDLSRNNLRVFPYLGEMSNLRFMFIHENKLDIDSLIAIFERDGERGVSALRRGIIWVTYWGNRNQFNGRHYLANHTSVLAVDYYMVVEEERNQTVNVGMNYIKPFDQVTNIAQIFNNRRKFNKNATEEEYMLEFWQDIAEIRKKQIAINPVIRIQKYFRGWIYRVKQMRAMQQKQLHQRILEEYFNEWKSRVSFYLKIKRIFRKKDKLYLLYPIKEMRNQLVFRKMKAICVRTKEKLRNRKLNIVKQYKIYRLLEQNWVMMGALYESLHLRESKYIMIHLEGVEQFTRYVLPFVRNHNRKQNMEIVLRQNRNVIMGELYQSVDQNQKQLLRLVRLNERSMGMSIGGLLTGEYSKRYNYSLCRYEGKLRKVFSGRNVHFSGKQIEKMRKIAKSMSVRERISLSQFQILDGDQRVLRDVVRGVYYYNVGYFTKLCQPIKKLTILSSYAIRYISSIMTIQRIWRGTYLRTKLRLIIKDLFIKQRASIIIQRWYRNLMGRHRRIFILDMMEQLGGFNCQGFCLSVRKYLQVVNRDTERGRYRKRRLTFPEMNIGVYIKKSNKKLYLSWNHQSDVESVVVNSMMGKKLFPEYFIKRVFDGGQFLGPIRYGDEKSYDRCEISHLFHYGTEVSLFNRKGVEFMEVKCGSKYDCRLRVLGLKLLSYQFNHREVLEIVGKELQMGNYGEQQHRRLIGNECSIFVYEQNDEGEMRSNYGASSVRIYQFVSRFYINLQQNMRPSRYQSNLKIMLIDDSMIQSPMISSVNQQVRKKRVRSNQKFDISNFLISEVGQLGYKFKTREQNLSMNMRTRKQSLKNFKLQNKLKIKNRKKFNSMYQQNNDKFIFILDSQQNFKRRLLTQPELGIQEKSKEEVQRQSNNYQMEKRDKQYRRRKIDFDNRQKLKNVDSFTKNFVNQGNFIQNQFLYGQIKRLKTQGEKFVGERIERMKSQYSQKQQMLVRMKQQRMKKIQVNHQKHQEEVYRSMIERKSEVEKLAIRVRKNQEKQQHYRSAPKRMRINFAEECYPIIGKKLNTQNN